MNTSHLKQALQEAFGSKVFTDQLSKQVDQRVGQLKASSNVKFENGNDMYYAALKDLMGTTFSHNIERQVKERVAVLGRFGNNPPPAPGMGSNDVKPDDKIETPFNTKGVKGTPEQEALTKFSIKGDVSGDINATQKEGFEAKGPEKATEGSGGNTVVGGVESRVAAATNSGSNVRGPGAGNQNVNNTSNNG